MGFTPATPLEDKPRRYIKGKELFWQPKNFNGKYLGSVSLRQALALSLNSATLDLAQKVGPKRVAEFARKMGITGDLAQDLSLALGSSEVSLLELTSSYAPFANGGFLAKGYGIQRIRTASGRVLYDHDVGKPARQQVIGTPALQYMNQMMRQVVTSGTGTRARVAGYDLAGKTGTTSDYRDAWFVGYTGGFVTAVWVGKDDNSPMRRVSGGGAPAGVWRDFMAAALPRLKAQPIPGGEAPEPEPPAPDPIGDIIDGVADLIGGGNRQAPPERAPAETPPY